MTPLPSLDRLLLPLLAAALIGYLLGAVPFGYLVARAQGVDIFEAGSKSPGATNVRRVLGARAGNLVFVLDLAKGAVAGAWPLVVIGQQPAAKLVGTIGMVFALLGHSYSCFTHFKGGKGVATTAGGLIVLMPVVVLVAAALWAIAYFTSRYVSVASIISAASVPVAAYLRGEPSFLVAVAAVVGLFVIFRHRSNLARLIQGTENKGGRPK